MTVSSEPIFLKPVFHEKIWGGRKLQTEWGYDQGGVGRPKSGGVGPGFDLEQEQVRARREIEAGDRPAPPLDHRFLEDIEELL